MSDFVEIRIKFKKKIFILSKKAKKVVTSGEVCGIMAKLF